METASAEYKVRSEQVHPGLVSPSPVRHMSGLAHAKSNADAFDCEQTILGLRNL